jgi:hypothetical protein
MALNSCNCPLPAAISDLTASTCGENWGQIQKVIIQRRGDTFDGTLGNDITVLADWQTRTGAADDTKAVITPFVYNAIVTAGESITNGGGDNTTLGGEVELVGVNPSVFAGMFQSLTSAQIAELQTLNCENSLGVYFVTQDQKIIANEVSTGEYTGFPVSSFFVGDKGNEGFATKDKNAFSFNMEACWSAAEAVTVPAFNPLTAL